MSIKTQQIYVCVCDNCGKKAPAAPPHHIEPLVEWITVDVTPICETCGQIIYRVGQNVITPLARVYNHFCSEQCHQEWQDKKQDADV